MRTIPAFDPSQPTTGQALIQIGSAGAGSRILMYNHSPYNLHLDFQNGSTSILHAWEARYWILDGETPSIAWSIDSQLNVATPPLSRVTMELFDQGELLGGQYPIDISQQTSVSNPGGIPVATTSITNDGNAGGVNVVEATQAGAPASNVIIENDGTLTLAQFVSAVRTIVLQTIVGVVAGGVNVKLSDAGHQTEVLGDLKVDGNTFVAALQMFGNLSQMVGGQTGNYTLDSSGNLSIFPTGAAGSIQLGLNNIAGIVLAAFAGGVTYLKSPTEIQLQVPQGTGMVRVTNTGLNIISGNLKWRTGDTLSQTHSFTGTGTGTYAHGCVAAPFAVLPMTNVSGSQTMGFDSVTATQVHITAAGGLNFTAVCFVG